MKEFRIRIPTGSLVNSPEEAIRAAEGLKLPVAIKAQIVAGQRQKSGGVVFADNIEDVKTKATQLLSASVRGLPVEKLLIEEKVEIDSEFYASITADPRTRNPVAIVSSKGGTEIEKISATRPHLVKRRDINILRGLRRYESIHLISSLHEVPPKQVFSLADLLTNLYGIYRRYDCRLVEVNPIALTNSGLVAIDSRIEVDNDALFRQPSLGLDSFDEAGDRLPTELEVAAGKIDKDDHRGTAHFVQLDLDSSYSKSLSKVPIGFDCVGTGSSLITMDELVPLGYYPVNFSDTSGNPTGSKLYRITKVIFSQPHIQGYLFVSCVSGQQLDNTARGIIKALLELFPNSDGKPDIPAVLVFRGAFEEEAIKLFKQHGITESSWVKVLGLPTTEREAAQTFDQLYKEWEKQKGENL